MDRRHLVTVLARAFPRADSDTLEELAGSATVARLSRGDILYREGEPATAMHLVLTGRLAVRARDPWSGDRILAYIGEGESLGEIALITGGRRTATVVAARDSTLASLGLEAFARATTRCPGAVLDLAQTAIRRFIATQRNERTRAALKHVVVLPLLANEWVAEFARRLQLALMRFGSTRYLDSRIARAMTLSSSSTSSDWEAWNLTRLIEDSEKQWDFTISLADSALTPWTRCVVGQADRVLLVAQGDHDPRVTPIEEQLDLLETQSGLMQRELVLAHFSSGPTRTSAWLDGRRPDRHHHVPWLGNSGFHRLARVLSGNAITLVLSGGGARGFAHIGVVRALREAGVPIDGVGGTSFGGLVAAALAVGRTDEEMLEDARKVFIEGGLLDDYTLPLISVVRGRRMEDLLRETFGAADISDAWVPFFAVSANLSRGALQVHRDGPFWQALRATVSLPGIFPPAIDRGELLVDGGLLNNFPVDIMKEIVPSRVVAVDLSLDDGYRFTGESLPSPLELLMNYLRGDKRWTPTITYVLMKSTTLSSALQAQAARAQADLCLQPPVSEFDMLDWSRLYEIVDLGYRYAQRVLDAWLSSHTDWTQPREMFDSRSLSRWCSNDAWTQKAGNTQCASTPAGKPS